MNYADALAGLDCPAPTARRLKHNIRRWQAHSGDPDLIRADFDRFRRAALAAGYSPRTVESTINDVIYVARRRGIPLQPGRRLRIPAPQPAVPSLGAIARVYLAADSATYPRRSWATAAAWWRCLLVIALWTGFRRGDLARLAWDDIGPDLIQLRASKTGKLHRIPLVPLVSRHLAQLDNPGHPLRIFDMPRTNSFAALADQLNRLCLAARVPPLTLKGLRRASITMWASANAEAGRIVHGCGLGIMRHYIDPLAILHSTARYIQLPPEFSARFQPPSDSNGQGQLLQSWLALTRTQRDLLTALALELTGGQSVKTAQKETASELSQLGNLSILKRQRR